MCTVSWCSFFGQQNSGVSLQNDVDTVTRLPFGQHTQGEKSIGG
jgi:hypothetical protein